VSHLVYEYGVGSYVVMIGGFGVFMSWMTIQRRKNAEAMRKNVLAKFKSGITLSSKDVVNIGKSFDLTAFQSRKVIYKIFRDADDGESFSRLQSLIQEIEVEEPFDDLPDEVKPSLVRLTKISKDTKEESDKHILSPIIHTLNKYVEVKSEQEKLKKQTTRAYAVSIISFVIGAVSFYFTLTAPSASEIAQEINSIETEIAEEHNKSSKKDAQTARASS